MPSKRNPGHNLRSRDFDGRVRTVVRTLGRVAHTGRDRATFRLVELECGHWGMVLPRMGRAGGRSPTGPESMVCEQCPRWEEPSWMRTQREAMERQREARR